MTLTVTNQGQPGSRECCTCRARALRRGVMYTPAVHPSIEVEPVEGITNAVFGGQVERERPGAGFHRPARSAPPLNGPLQRRRRRRHQLSDRLAADTATGAGHQHRPAVEVSDVSHSRQPLSRATARTRSSLARASGLRSPGRAPVIAARRPSRASLKLIGAVVPMRCARLTISPLR
jgi:hypothetical protein